MIASSGSTGRKKRPVNSSTATSQELMSLVERQDFRCALTGRELSPDAASIDHIVPASQGGTNEISNLQVVTKEANFAKGAMGHDEFIAPCRDVVATEDARIARVANADG